MQCPKCKSTDSRVIKTDNFTQFKLRIRECITCFNIYKTKEELIIETPSTPPGKKPSKKTSSNKP